MTNKTRALRTIWIKTSEQLPPENVSVLVFIPEEDNHCTTGMWDVSKKWVLLDEYRVPKSEVTYWAEMVELPEDKNYTPAGPSDIYETLTETISRLQKQIFDLENLVRAADHVIEFRSTEPPIRSDEFGMWVEKFKPIMKAYRDLKTNHARRVKNLRGSGLIDRLKFLYEHDGEFRLCTDLMIGIGVSFVAAIGIVTILIIVLG